MQGFVQHADYQPSAHFVPASHMPGWDNNAIHYNMSSHSNIVTNNIQHQNQANYSAPYPDGSLNPNQSFSQVNRFLPQYIIEKPSSNCGIQVNVPGQYATLAEINGPSQSNNTEEVLPMQQSIANSYLSSNGENNLQSSSVFFQIGNSNPVEVVIPVITSNKTRDNGEYYFDIFVNYPEYCCIILM